MASGLLNIGASALNAAYLQLQTTSHNIANVNTPGYHRQDAVQQSVEGTSSGLGFVGRGVQIVTVRRQYDAFLERELSLNQAASSADEARATQMSQLDRLFAATDTGLGAAMDDLRSGLADLVNNPSDTAARTVALNRADAFAARIRDTSGQLSEIAYQTDQRIAATAKQLNGLLQRLGALNNEIATQSGAGHSPNDLLDQRDDLVNQVNKIVKANPIVSADGTVSLFASGGEALVVNATVANFDVGADTLDPSKSQLVLKTLGASVPVDSATLGGGELAGLMRFRDEDLAAARWRVGQMAAAIGSAFNAQQAVGLDATGAAGQPMFTMNPPVVSSAVSNTGNAVLGVAIGNASQLAASDYVLTWNGSAYQVTRQSDGTQSTLAGLPATIDGLTLSTTSGTPAVGDRFLVRSGSVMASGFTMALSSPSRLASGLGVMPQMGAANGGDVATSAFKVNTVGANLTQPVTLTFTGAGTFDVTGTGTGNPTGVAYAAGQPISYNGWSLTLKGTPKAGDTVTLTPTASPSTDNRNAKAMFDLVDQRVVNGSSFNSAYADMLADIGARAQTANTAQAMSSQSLADAKASRDEVAGVNLDEEAARMMQFQQAYQAAAKLIATAQTLFTALLNATGG
jgi:flagellar hook-associated protein 1 FlgK